MDASAPPPRWLIPGPFPAPVETGERCAIRELWNDPAHPRASLAEATVAPGVTTQLHALDGVAEIYLVLSGSGLVEIDGQSAPVGPGARVAIPPGAAQRITNTGPEPLVFLCLCTPRFVPACYRPLD